MGPATSINHSVPSEDELHQMLGLSYPLYGPSGNSHLSNPYAYVDPSQILGYSTGNEIFLHNLQTSPASDPTTGFNSSATASPEPGTSDSGSKSRKIISIKRSVQINSNSFGKVPESTEEENTAQTQESDTPPDGGADGRTEDSNKEVVATLCSNCHTTNTPLWRRDAEGQPLCEPSWRLC
jgi:GATA-binding protein